MHLETLWVHSDLGFFSPEHSFSASSESIRRWTFLPSDRTGSALIWLAALACTGRRHVAQFLRTLPQNSEFRAQPLHLEFVLVRHAPRERGIFQQSRTYSAWQIGRDGSIQSLPPSERHLDCSVRFCSPPSGAGNSGWLLLGYGPHIGRQPVSGAFDFADPHHRLRRFAGLFDPQTPLTDPVAFLNRLHLKGVLYERGRSLAFISKLNSALSGLLKIEPSAWLAKRYDFEGLWRAIPGNRRRIATVCLDVARHVLDASEMTSDPFQQTGVVLMDRMQAWCRSGEFKELVFLLESLFPGLQFIMTLPNAFRAVLPRRLRNQTLAVPRAAARPEMRKRVRVPPRTIVLLDVDSTLPNLALMKLSRYFKQQGKRVVLARRKAEITKAEAVYASCVFAFPQSARRVEALREFYGADLQLGGSGVDVKLRLPPEIENLPPDYSLYPEMGDRALGFLTRGCPLHCPFCIVPIKEGKPRLVSDFDSLLQGRKQLILLDDNILSHPAAIALMEEMLRRDLAVNFNQTLDVRLLTPATAGLLRRIRCSNVRFTRRNYYFSLNNTRGLNLVRERYRLLEVTRSDNVEFVAMYGFDTTLAQDVERFRFLRSLPGAYVFVQRYRPVLGGPEADLSDFFDDDAGDQIDALLEINFAQNMKSMEVYYRWVCREYARQRGRIHRKLVDTLYRYNQRHRMGGFLLKLQALCAGSTLERQTVGNRAG